MTSVLVVINSNPTSNNYLSICLIQTLFCFSNYYFTESNERYSFYLNKITEAKANYHPCEATKCNCHSKVITHDLKPFKGGISKELIDSVREK